MGRTRMLAGLLLCAGLALTACGGGGGGDDGVASLGGSTTTTAADGASSGDDQADALVSYVRCLRKEGIEVKDPEPVDDADTGFSAPPPPADGGKAGAVMMTPAGRIELPSPDDPAFKKADEKCQPILERARQNLPKPSAEEQAEARDRALAFARCMREHGVDMPDPQFDEDGRISISMPAQVKDDPTAPLPADVQRAQEACQDKMPKPGAQRADTGKAS